MVFLHLNEEQKNKIGLINNFDEPSNVFLKFVFHFSIFILNKFLKAIGEFCRIAIEFIQSDLNNKMINTAARNYYY
jgi:hypothetical protein